MNASMCFLSCSTDVKDPSRIENQISTWLNQKAPGRSEVEMHVRIALEPTSFWACGCGGPVELAMLDERH